MRSNARKSKQQPTVTPRARQVVECPQRIFLISWSGLPGSLACCISLLAVIKSCRRFGCDQIGHDSECRRYRSELFIAICKAQNLRHSVSFSKRKTLLKNEARDRKINSYLSFSAFFFVFNKERQRERILFFSKERKRQKEIKLSLPFFFFFDRGKVRILSLSLWKDRTRQRTSRPVLGLLLNP